MQRTFRLATLPYHCNRIVGSRNGYLTIADGCHLGALNPVTGEEIELLALPNNLWPRRVMLGPNLRPDCNTAVAMCHHNYVTKVACMTSGGTEWRITDASPWIGQSWLIYSTMPNAAPYTASTNVWTCKY